MYMELIYSFCNVTRGHEDSSFLHFVVESALLCSSSLFHEMINFKWTVQSLLVVLLFYGYRNPALEL